MKFIDGPQALFVLSYLVRAERLSFLSPKTNIWPCWLSCQSFRIAGQQVSVKSLESITLGSAERSEPIEYLASACNVLLQSAI